MSRAVPGPDVRAREAVVSRAALLTAPAMLGFAANSLLCRAALAPRLADPATFTGVRLGAGAAALWLLVGLARRSRPSGGTWTSGAALFAYAAAFSLAYVRIPASVGALLLFAAVQISMIAWAVATGERPARRQWLGIGLALGGLASLTLPGARAPDPTGAALMLLAGGAWGAYSVRGRGASAPLATTADNFARSLPLAAAFLLWNGRPEITVHGTALAAASGAVASGLGYALWYAAVPALGVTRAAAVQLSVPVLAAGGGALLLGEPVTARLVVSGSAIVAGIALATLTPRAG
jgi:drug/metabolite transporter (DMT)-like permease